LVEAGNLDLPGPDQPAEYGEVEMVTTSSPRPLGAALLMAVLLAGLWVLEIFDQLTGEHLDNLGIHAQELDGLPEIFTAPFLHAGWDHLAGNSLPFFVLGFLVLLGGIARWLVSSLVSVVASGLAAWLLTPPGTIILGASGLIFGWLTYLLARAVWSRRPGQVALAVLVLFLYGGLIWGVLPGASGVSWQAHLGGAAGGVLAAWLLHRRETERLRLARTRAYPLR
jgi:membrane associated rhomboid family serine protease